MATVYLIRHGQASFGSDDYDRLSELGCRQAVVLGEYLEQCGIVFDAVYSGELLRQRDTAELACERQPGELNLHIDARFNEIDNDAQLKYLVPEVVKTNKQVQELMERGLKASKDYQKVIDAVFNYGLGSFQVGAIDGLIYSFKGCVHDCATQKMDKNFSQFFDGIFELRFLVRLDFIF